MGSEGIITTTESNANSHEQTANGYLIQFMRTLLLLLITLQLTASAQDWHPPLDPPLYLSGSFGELRSNHFHSGIDIKTGGVEGKPVYAVERGEIVRIRVGPAGFGKVLYMKHPNGKTSVYAHLSEFDSVLAAYVKSEQYRLQQFALDLYPTAGRYTYQKGDEIAKSGNSGSSGGPHLHFEIRDTRTEHPLDPVAEGFEIADHRAPLMENLMLVPIGRDAICNGERKTFTLPLIRSGVGEYRVSRPGYYKLSGTWGFAIETVDQQDGGSNKNGTVALKMWLNDSLHYQHSIDEFSFDETRYLNSLITFDQYKCCSDRASKLYVEPNNQLSFVQGNPAGYSFSDSSSNNLKIEASDRAGNRSILEFDFEGITPESQVSLSDQPLVYPDDQLWLAHNEVHRLPADDARCIIPAGVLYADTYFPVEVSEPSGSMHKSRPFFSPVYRFGHTGIPAHTYFTLDLPLESLPTGLREEQLCFVEIEDNGRLEWWPGDWTAGRFVGRSREFGRYAITADTLAPSIDPVNIFARKNMNKDSTILVRISDDFSGIDQITGTIDNEWVLMEWDPKTRRLWYTFDEHCGPGEHTFELRVTDNCSNTAEYVVFFSR